MGLAESALCLSCERHSKIAGLRVLSLTPIYGPHKETDWRISYLDLKISLNMLEHLVQMILSEPS